jgi:uncharacterized protein (DUF736 family)
MIIGNFKQQDEGYAGFLYSIGLGLPHVVVRPVPAKVGNGPNFALFATFYEEGEFEIGAAWAKTSKAGKAYLSIKLDGPMLFQPINCALIQQQDGTHALVWNRKEADSDQAAA